MSDDKKAALDYHSNGRHGKIAIVSTKPCKMCAAMITDFLPVDFRGEILFLQDDPGPKAKDTALDGKKYFSQIDGEFQSAR